MKEYRRQVVRDASVQAKYEDYLETREEGTCPFCIFDRQLNQVVEETAFSLVFKCAFPYKDCQDHLIHIPKRHMEQLIDMSNKELLDWSELVSKYAATPKSLVLARGKDHDGKSQTHLHTHIIQYERVEDI